MINKLAIIGVGLIGGSLAQALKKADLVGEVTGYTRRPEQLQHAVDLGILDFGAVSISQAVDSADMVILSTPVAAMNEIFQEVANSISANTVITDVGSVKQSIISVARRSLGSHFKNFVPGHPIAGAELSGPDASYAEMFSDHRVVLTPVEETSRQAVDQVNEMWVAAGARVVEMDANSHDEIFAACSHVPHLLAYALVDSLIRRDDHETIFKFAAGGFRDFTRIASSDPVMWRDICAGNREAIVRVLKRYRDDLDRLTDLISEGDTDELEEIFKRAKHARDTYMLNKLPSR
jgi:prephenate dehydrogenase